MRSWIWLSLSLLVLGSLIAPLSRTAAEPTEMVRGGGFEGGETQGIGNDWWSETWGNATVHFDLAADKVMFGKRCQHIRVEGYKDGAAQIRQMGMKVTRGQQYTLVLWLRGNLAVPVSVGFRKHQPPYTYYLQQEVHVTPTWQRFSITGVCSDDDPDAGLFLYFSGDGDLWIDNISAKPDAAAAQTATVTPVGLREPATPPVSAAAEPAEMVRSGGFESGEANGIGNDWWSETWGNATVHFDLAADKVMFGKRCQHIRVEGYKDGAAQIRQMGMKVTRGQQYTLVLWLRGNLAVPVSVGFRKHQPPYTYYLQQEVHVTPTWQRFSITGVCSDDDPDAGLFLYFSGDGDLWIDNISAKAGAPIKT